MAGQKKSLDELERELWNPGPSMLDEAAEIPQLREGEEAFPQAEVYRKQYMYSLNGKWKLDEDRTFEHAVMAEVPCSIHTALLEAGVIPDPMEGLNDKTAREYSYREWWLEREFSHPHLGGREILKFEGVCYRAHIWLNGKFLGSHSGMFGSFEFDVTTLLQEHNRLVVRIDNAPVRKNPISDFMDNDDGWKDGVVINCVYGWHYACIPSRGIWAPVYLYRKPEIFLERPFAVSQNPQNGEMDVCIRVLEGNGAIEIGATISPGNFEGKSYSFKEYKKVTQGEVVHWRMNIEEPRLWYPSGIGEQNLYTLKILAKSENGEEQYFETVFAFRKIEMVPLAQGVDSELYNWCFQINGRKMFAKGANWCTLDALLRFPRERYRRFLTMAKEENIQLLRAWGGGMPESDTFYELCDELGIMVMQEWPTCWDSQKQQPYNELEETVRQHMVRLRNHPSLIMWCGGNESREADGEAMEMMGRYAYELDGSRCFHRTSPWGGGLHNYETYWEMKDMDVSMQLESPFLGEFGMASVPNPESVKRYLPHEEWKAWPVDKYSAFAHHTPRFNQLDPCDMDYLKRHAQEFAELTSMENFIWATQIAQATAIRHTLENYRSRWPYAGAACFYKMTDVYPAASWAVVDYYGIPKLSYYLIADSFAHLHAALLFKSVRALNGLSVPVVLMDDGGRIGQSRWEIRVEAWNRDLMQIKSCVYTGSGMGETVKKAGTFLMQQEETDGRLLLISIALRVDGELRDSTFYWLNYEKEPGCLLRLAQSSLSARMQGGELLIHNTGEVPAVGVTVENPSDPEEFIVSDSVFWMNPGEERRIEVNLPAGVRVKAWNCEEIQVE